MMTLDRAELLRVCGLVRPALAGADYVPAWQHIEFKAGYATAFNDVAGISIATAAKIDRCVPGELLVRALASFATKDVAAAFTDEAVVLSSGRSKIKLPSLPLKAFEFDMPFPDATDGRAIPLNAEMFDAFEACMLSMGTDPKHPASMGLTLEQDENGCAVVYSTDRVTLSRMQTKTKIELPAGAPLILPAFLVQQVVKLADAFGYRNSTDAAAGLYILEGGLLVEFGETAVIYTKTLVDLEPMEFGRVLKQHCEPAKIEQKSCAIPDAMDGAIERALLMLGKAEPKSTEFISGTDELRMVSRAGNGEAEDEMSFVGEVLDCSVDPSLLAKALKVCDRMVFLPKSVVLTAKDGRFLHLVSHQVKRK